MISCALVGSLLLGHLATAAAGVQQHPLLAPSPKSGTSDAKLITPDFSTWVEDLLEDTFVGGYSVAVIRPANATIPEEFGTWGNRTEDGEKMTPDTLFTLASVSKAFLATSVGILIDDFAHGRNVTSLPKGLTEFTWNTKLRDLLPEDWALMDEWASEKASVHDLLSHVSGLPRHEFSYGPFDSPKDVIRRLRYLRPAYELREKWHYNNQPFMLFAHLVTQLSGVPFETFVSDRIFAPLDMSSSTYWPFVAAVTGRFTQSYSPERRRIPNWFEDDVVPLLSGAGGVISSATDLTKWVRFLLGGAAGNVTGMEVPRAVVEECMRAHAIVPDSEKFFEAGGLLTYGMGWFQSIYHDHPLVWHTGSIPGISSLVALFPEDQIGFVLLSNTHSRAELNFKVLLHLADTAFGLTDASQPESKPSPRPDPELRAYEEIGSSVPLGAFAGVYTDPGYGTFELCAPQSDSPQCTSTLKAFASVPNASVAAGLYTAWPRIWSSYLRLTRTDNLTFSFDGATLYPSGYGADATPFAFYEEGGGARAEFALDEEGHVTGLGFLGLVGEVTERERIGTTVEERAEVWFKRI